MIDEQIVQNELRNTNLIIRDEDDNEIEDSYQNNNFKKTTHETSSSTGNKDCGALNINEI